jgi:hypothetical protein
MEPRLTPASRRHASTGHCNTHNINKTTRARRRRALPVLLIALIAIAGVVAAMPGSSPATAKGLPQAVAPLPSNSVADSEVASRLAIAPDAGDLIKGLPSRLSLSASAPWSTSGSFSPSAPLFAETIDTFGADCTTPKSTFYLGETVCAKTDGVAGTPTSGEFVNWILTNPTPVTVVSGGQGQTDITTNTQTFTFTPTQTGAYKASIAIPGDISQTPAGFTVVPAPPFATYTGNCAMATDSFSLGDTICVKASGPVDARRVQLVDPDYLITNSADLTQSPQTFMFTLPSAATGTLFDVPVDNRGRWLVKMIDTSDASAREVLPISVHDPAQTVADLQVNTIVLGDTTAVAGSNVSILVWVFNVGPDAAQSASFSNASPANTTFQSLTQTAGPTFTCSTPPVNSAGTTTCTKSSLNRDVAAGFIINYKVNTSIPNGSDLSTTATVTSSTSDNRDASNSSDSSANASNPTPPPCTLACPSNFPAFTDLHQDGAIVNFSSPASTSGTCGTATSVPASGSFFAIGSTAVTTTLSSGETCSFIVTVSDNEAPSINCPGNITVTEPSFGTGSTVNYTGLSASDNSGSASISCKEGTDDRPSGSHFDAGTHNIACTATDEANNTSNSCFFDVIVNAAPACTFEPHANVTADAPANACNATVTYDAPTTTGGTACDGATFTCDHPSGSSFPVGGTLVTCALSPGGSTTTFTVTVNDVTAPVPNLSSLPTISGECTATAGVPTTVVITDQFGNPNDHFGHPFGTKVVNEPPTATDTCGGTISGATSDQRTYDEPGTYTVHWTYTDASGNATTQNQTVIITGPNGGLSITGAPVVSVHNGLGSTSCSIVLDDLTAVLNTVVSGTCNSFDITRSVSPTPVNNVFNVGTNYTVVSTVTDGSNTASITQTLKIIDDTPPTITAPPAVTVNADPTSCAVSLASVALGSPLTGVHCGSPSVTNNAPSAFPLGSTTVTWTVTDTSGHTATDTQVVTVVDHTPPTITAPNIVVSNDAGSCSAVVNFTGLSASDNCGTANINTTIASGSIFPKGTTTVTATATDDAGNTTTKNFTVTVNDTEKPVLNAPNIVVSNDAGSCSAVVNFSVTATDNCGGVNVNTSVPSGTTFPKGTTTVTATATDTSGNTTTKNFTVTVNDTEMPVVNVPANIVVYLPLNSTATSMQVTYSVTFSDNCGVQSSSVSPVSGTVFSVGTTTVTATATDTSGNVTTKTFTVTVLYNFTGFFSPVSNPPILNVVNAGRAIPVKFSLSGNKGLNIFAVNSPTSGQVTCGTSTQSDIEETVTAGSSSLSYSAGSDQYNYVWKTENTWAGTCRVLNFTFNDGTTRTALFKFK